MRVIQITDADAQKLLDDLSLAEFRIKSEVDPRLVDDIHRRFNYIVVRWLQNHGATGLHT